MKRSEINKIMRDAVGFAEEHGFKLPPFVTWSPEDWKTKGAEYDEVRKCMLGWDITDYGKGDFRKAGLLMLTIRNGSLDQAKGKTYAEKMLIVEECQITPYHFHWNKTEDIINRGGGILCIQLYNSTEDGKFADTNVTVSKDGRKYTVSAGSIVEVMPGESITLTTGLYHQFWGKDGCGKILVGEISKINDDNVDNRFYENIERFPEIEEDEEPLYLLFSEYPDAVCEAEYYEKKN